MGTDGSPLDEPDGGGGDPFTTAVHHPFLALAGARRLPRRDRPGQLGQLALLPLPGRWWPGRAAPGGAVPPAPAGAPRARAGRRAVAAAARPGRWGWPGSSCSRPAGPTPRLTLSFLDLGRAEALREHLLELAGRTDEVAPGPRPARSSGSRRMPWRPPPPRGPRRSRCSRCRTGGCSSRPSCTGRPSRSARCVVFGLIGAGVRSVGPLALAGIPALLPVAIGIAFNRVKELLTHGNFHLADAGTGVRVQEGLTDLRATTIPLHRIQALELVQPLWWRPRGLVPHPGQRRRVRRHGRGRGAARDDAAAGRHARRRPARARPGHPRGARGRLGRRRARRGRRPRVARADLGRPVARPPVVAAQRLDRRGVGRAAAPRPAHPSGDRGAARPHPVAHRAPGLARDPARPGDRCTSSPRPDRSRRCWPTSTSRTPRASSRRCPNAPASARRRSEPPRAPLAPDPPGLVDWSRHPQGTPEPERP